MSSETPYQKRVAYQVSPSCFSVALQSSSGRLGSSVRHTEGLLTEKQVHHGNAKEFFKGGRSRATFDMVPDKVPDVALLEIFDFYIGEELRIEAWHTLVHVCKKWRILVFGSSRRLNLRLHCKTSTAMKEALDIWPPLPIVMNDSFHRLWSVDNIVAALKHNNRICQLELSPIPGSQLERVLAALQQPFPELTRLQLRSINKTAPVDPDSFLGGSASRLQSLYLQRVSFPGLSKLLLSATHLVYLDLSDIPHSGYISPEAMATCLSALSSLEGLRIEFESPQSRPDPKKQPPPPQTRTLLPVLTWLAFRGVGEYLKDLVARIDAPLLNDLEMIFEHYLMFDAPQIAQFISRSTKINSPNVARVLFSDWDVSVILPHSNGGKLKLVISNEQLEPQLSSLARVCMSPFPQNFFPAVECLYIIGEDDCSWVGDIKNSQWVELLDPLTAVKDLYMSCEITPYIASALQELVGEGVTEVLPALQTIFLELLESSQETIGQFTAARELASHPIAVSRWERENEDEEE